MLDHPELYWSHLYQYYSFRARTNIWIVILGIFLLINIIHFTYWKHRHYYLKKMLFEHPSVQQKLSEKIIKNSLNINLEIDTSEIILKKYPNILDNIAIMHGFAAIAPKFPQDLLFLSMYNWPFYICEFFIYHFIWYIKFSILETSYNLKEKQF